jgi:hypothetical protein
LRKEFLIERQGRQFCLYAGLLDLAHEKGLRSIHTELIQAPTDANNRVAICSATVVLDRDGIERTFTGLGDAAPNNVTPAMQTCLLRMAETRAKARALRDAVNIGMAAAEELGEEEERSAQPSSPSAKGRVSQVVGTRTINTSGATCSECHAPAGKAHADRCSLARAAA